MRKYTSLSAALVAAFSLGAVACGDDGGEATDTSSPDTTQPDTTPDTTPGETTPETTEETTPEVTPTDPCDPNPCSGKAAECNAEGQLVTYAAPGACGDEDGEAVCTYTPTAADCDAGEVCAAGACVAAGDACSYDYDARVSVISQLEVADEDCCFDFGGRDDAPDNAFGGLLSLATTFGFDVNATLAEQIQSGGLILLLETRGVTSLTSGSGITVNGFNGADADADASNNLSGTASFLVEPNSFQAGTAMPLIHFPDSAIASGVLAAGPAQFRLNLPVLGTALELVVDGTQLEAAVSEGALGADGGLAMGGVEGGKLGGFVGLENLATAFNTYLDGACSCVAKNDDSQPYLGTAVSGSKVTITSNVKNGSACTGEDEDTCAQIAGFLPAIAGLISPDIDGDDDGIDEAISIGVRIWATSAKIDGTVGCE